MYSLLPFNAGHLSIPRKTQGKECRYERPTCVLWPACQWWVSPLQEQGLLRVCKSDSDKKLLSCLLVSGEDGGEKR